MSKHNHVMEKTSPQPPEISHASLKHAGLDSWLMVWVTLGGPGRDIEQSNSRVGALLVTAGLGLAWAQVWEQQDGPADSQQRSASSSTQVETTPSAQFLSGCGMVWRVWAED